MFASDAKFVNFIAMFSRGNDNLITARVGKFISPPPPYRPPFGKIIYILHTVKLSTICVSYFLYYTYGHRRSEGGGRRSLAPPPFSQKLVWKGNQEGQFFKIFLNTTTFEISPPPFWNPLTAPANHEFH